MINSDRDFNVIQTDDSHVYRRDSEEKYIHQHSVMSQARCYFNGGPQLFITSCEADSTFSGRGINKFILGKFQAFMFNKTAFPLLINGVTLPMEKVLTQIIHSSTMNVASNLYTGVSVTPSQFHTVLQSLGFEEQEPQLDFQMIWNDVKGKSYVTATSVLLGIFTILGIGWLMWKCIPVCKKYHKGYRLQTRMEQETGTRESVKTDAQTDSETRPAVIEEPVVIFRSTPSAPPAETGGERIVKFQTRSTGTTVFPRDRRGKLQ